MKETINIFNHYHYGDVFYSRSIVQSLFERYNINFYHNLKHGLFKDLPNVTEITPIPNKYYDRQTLGESYVNVWLGIHNVKHACSFYSYLEIIQKVCQYFKTDLIDSIDLLPKVNYSNLQSSQKILSKITNYKNNFKKIILISTGDVLSGQALNFNFTPIIDNLSENFKDVLFLTTSRILSTKDNLIYTGDITEISSDLLEISYISKFCDIIVGRASGPYCFTQTHENMTNKDKTFISFCHNELEGVFFKECDSKKIWSNNFTYESVYEHIKKELEN